MTEEGTLKGRIVPAVRTEASCVLWALGCRRVGHCLSGGGGGCRCLLTETWHWATVAQTSSWRGISREIPAVAKGVNNTRGGRLKCGMGLREGSRQEVRLPPLIPGQRARVADYMAATNS